MIKPSQAIVIEFETANPTTGAAADADSTPTGTLTVNGTDNAATVTVTKKATGSYKAAVTIPANVSAGDSVGLRISATVASVAGVKTVWSDFVDTKRLADLNDLAAGAAMTLSDNAITDAKIADNALTAAKFAAGAFAAVWNTLTSAATTVGSIGKKLADWAVGNVVSVGGVTVTLASEVDANLTKIASAAVNAALAQLGVNVVNWKGSAAPAMTGDAYAVLTNLTYGLAALKTALDAKASQTSVDDLPTNAELATALAAADDAVLAAIGALNNLSQAQAQSAAAAAITAAGLALEETLTAIKGAEWSSETLKAIKDAIPAAAPSAAAIRQEMDSNSTQLAAILEDTGTTLDGKLTTIAGYIDTEVAQIISAIAALNNLSQAQAQAAAAAALSAYDPPTKDELDTAIASVGGGSGARAWTLTLTESGSGDPIAGASVWVTTDEAGSNVVASGASDAYGQVACRLDDGTVYSWKSLAGYNFANNPKTHTVDAEHTSDTDTGTAAAAATTFTAQSVVDAAREMTGDTVNTEADPYREADAIYFRRINDAVQLLIHTKPHVLLTAAGGEAEFAEVAALADVIPLSKRWREPLARFCAMRCRQGEDPAVRNREAAEQHRAIWEAALNE